VKDKELDNEALRLMAETMEHLRHTAETMERDIPIIRVCKLCGSDNIAKHGIIKGVLRYRCKDCKRTFMADDNLPDMKTPKDVITSALNMYYEGMSLHAIRRQLDLMHGYRPSVSTLYGWLTRYSDKAIRQAERLTPQVGDVWIADETVLKLDFEGNVWFWDLIDAKTRFLLASHLSAKRTTADALKLMKMAEERAGKVPELILTDKLHAYTDGIELAWGADAKHVPSKGFKKPMNTNIIERMHSTIKSRTKVMRGLKDIRSAKRFMDGWLIHYNYFRPHEYLGGKTPAEKAGIAFPFKNWGDVVTGKEDAVDIRVRFIRASPKRVKRRVTRKHRALVKSIPSLKGIR